MVLKFLGSGGSVGSNAKGVLLVRVRIVPFHTCSLSPQRGNNRFFSLDDSSTSHLCSYTGLCLVRSLLFPERDFYSYKVVEV